MQAIRDMKNRNQKRRLLLAALAAGWDYNAIAASLSPVLWYKFNETSGTTVINYGSLGSGNGTWTPGAGALGQTDSMGANEAYLFDALDSKVTGPTSTSINNVNKLTSCIKVKATSSGEASNGYLWTDGGNRVIAIFSGASSPYVIQMAIWNAPAFASCTTSVATGVIQNDDMWIFGTYDDTTDRTPHLFYGNSGSVAEFTYQATVSAANTLSNGSGALLVGNNSTSVRTWGGLIGEYLFFNKVLTTAEMLALTQSTGV